MQIIDENILNPWLDQSLSRSKNLARRMTDRSVNRKDELYKTCVDFEAIFIKQMLNVMRKTVHKSGFLEGGFAEEVFEDLLFDEYSKKMAENARFGFADLLYSQLSFLQ